ncbi:hypothetical protein [Sphingorhabdus lacus]|uniref:hypothetical protein n=1 Tax=Sphingorhabdus lacus TaxID=392610 RepID=UPI0035940EAC
MTSWVAITAGAILAVSAPHTVPDAQRDWGETLRTDAIALHEEISTSHPGMVNPDDPEFSAKNEAELAKALDRAKTAMSFADYFYAMQRYTASFNDAHMGFGVFGNTPDLVVKWPGFVARDDTKRGLKVTHSEAWSKVPEGARIISCDGKSGYEIGNARVGSRVGRWKLASQRQIFSGLVFVDVGDPYAEPIVECIFETGKGTQSVTLNWREAGDNFYNRMRIFSFGEPGKVNLSKLADGTIWVSLPTFNGDPESDSGKELRALVDEISIKNESIRKAPALVLDLRGNGGGSGQWAHEFGKLIWGESAYTRYPEAPMTIVWRTSRNNLSSIKQTFAQRDANGGLSESSRAWFLDTIRGLEEALEKGQDRWVIEPDLLEAPDPEEPRLDYVPPPTQVFVLTDAMCVSACLDAVDLWRRFGAVHAGQETGADTVYLETRQVVTPSGIGAMAMPMKYYKGRRRAANEPVVPEHIFAGDINDDTLVTKWLTSLIAR